MSGYIGVKSYKQCNLQHTTTTNLQDFFSYALQGECKVAVLDCKYDDDEGTIIVCIANVLKTLATCVTWTKKSSLGSRSIKKA